MPPNSPQVFLAEERSAAYDVDPSAKYAVRVDDADFQWESSPPDAAPKSKKEQAKLAAQGKTAAKIAKKERKEKEKAAKVELKLNEKGAADPEEAAHSGDATADIPDDGKLDPTTTPEEAEILQLRNVNLRIPRGQLCAVVGAVGCVPPRLSSLSSSLTPFLAQIGQELASSSPRRRDEAHSRRGHFWRPDRLRRAASLDAELLAQSEASSVLPLVDALS